MKDSGVKNIRVALKKGSSSIPKAKKAGFDVMTVSEAAKWADVMMMATQDELQSQIWKDHLGNQERIQIIQYCINHLDSRFRVIWCVPEDPNVFEGTREVADARPFDKKWFRIKEFNPETGEFSSESIQEN